MRTRRLVIDASVACAAGESDHPVSKASRDFLLRVRQVCHTLVMTNETRLEWGQHRSRFSSTWYASMLARRKVVEPSGCEDRALRARISRSGLPENQRSAMEQDVHLVEAALVTDRIVVSTDNSARRLFSVLAERHGLLRTVVWVNPAENPDRLVQWLEKGAKPVPKWRLGG